MSSLMVLVLREEITALQEEIDRLRAENARLRLERDSEGGLANYLMSIDRSMP